MRLGRGRAVRTYLGLGATARLSPALFILVYLLYASLRVRRRKFGAVDLLAGTGSLEQRRATVHHFAAHVQDTDTISTVVIDPPCYRFPWL